MYDKDKFMTHSFIAVGSDIAKDKIDIYIKDKKGLNLQIKNNETGFKKLLSKLPENSIVCMEATGHYYEKFADYLYHHGVKVKVVNPLKVKWYAKSEFKRTKTDKQDAKLIADYCEEKSHKLHDYQAPTPEQYKIKRLISYLSQLVQQKTALKNRLHSSQDDFIKSQIKQQIQDIKRYIKAAEQELSALSDNQLTHNLDTIPAIGATTAAILSYYLTFYQFEDKNKFTAFAGLSPEKHQSGESVNQPDKLTTLGNRTLRNALYMPAVVAYRIGLFRRFVQSMQSKGKKGKVIIVAIMRKLAVLAFTLYERNERYNERIRA